MIFRRARGVNTSAHLSCSQRLSPSPENYRPLPVETGFLCFFPHEPLSRQTTDTGTLTLCCTLLLSWGRTLGKADQKAYTIPTNLLQHVYLTYVRKRHLPLVMTYLLSVLVIDQISGCLVVWEIPNKRLLPLYRATLNLQHNKSDLSQMG